MGRVILFDGGKAGSLFIHGNTVRPIAPFSASVLAHLEAVSELLWSAGELSTDAKVSHELNVLTSRVANLALGRVEAVVGPLDDGDSLFYLNGKQGFVCNSNGAPPRPVDWPAADPVTMENFVERGLLGPDLVEFVRCALAKGLRLVDVLEDPIASAMIVGVTLSDLAVENLKSLAPSKLNDIADPINRGVMAFLHSVIQDGRYLETWMTEPVAVAASLGMELEREVVDRILGSTAIIGHAEPVARLSIQQGIVVGIVILILDRPDLETETVEDHSGLVKF
jgi:hypothetical protein